jgi:hypothetical protein
VGDYIVLANIIILQIVLATSGTIRCPVQLSLVMPQMQMRAQPPLAHDVGIHDSSAAASVPFGPPCDGKTAGQNSASTRTVIIAIQYVTAEWAPAFLRQAREFLFFPLLAREASKRVPIFDRGTGSKPEPERLRSGSLQADLSLIV